jgi:hypothetical protein
MRSVIGNSAVHLSSEKQHFSRHSVCSLDAFTPQYWIETFGSSSILGCIAIERQRQQQCWYSLAASQPSIPPQSLIRRQLII